MRKIEPSNPNVLSPKQLEAEFGISISKRQKLRMQKNKENDHISITIRKPSRTIFVMSDFSKQGLFSEIEPSTYTLGQKDNELPNL
ncbi:MAG: hypothetical protein SPJ16_04970 [Helicobacter sp.]|uniref:hypothetical protein n=1 Tax=Helicobacter sp. TaxID=218 RepID=UPI002A9174A0|nr:hypothetical protein [Helicobacter sp.]MDY5950528.1 hypothetical protein [Helicobacter sp.]